MFCYILFHDYRAVELHDEIKLIGVFRSRDSAQAVAENLVSQPGFRDYPDAFTISRYPADMTFWQSGFITLEEDDHELDIPAWAAEFAPAELETSAEFARRLMNSRYAGDNWPRGAETEYRQLIRWAEGPLKTEEKQ